MTPNEQPRPLHVFAADSGEDWFLAYDEADALALYAEHDNEDDTVTMIGDDALFSMHFTADDLPPGLRDHPEATTVEVEPFGDGWSRKVTATARLWGQFMPRGFLASTNY